MVPVLDGLEWSRRTRWVGDKGCWTIPLQEPALPEQLAPPCTLKANSWTIARDFMTQRFYYTGFILESPSLKYKYVLADSTVVKFAKQVLPSILRYELWQSVTFIN
jgi:hypothetical protein